MLDVNSLDSSLDFSNYFSSDETLSMNLADILKSLDVLSKSEVEIPEPIQKFLNDNNLSFAKLTQFLKTLSSSESNYANDELGFSLDKKGLFIEPQTFLGFFSSPNAYAATGSESKEMPDFISASVVGIVGSLITLLFAVGSVGCFLGALACPIVWADFAICAGATLFSGATTKYLTETVFEPGWAIPQIWEDAKNIL